MEDVFQKALAGEKLRWRTGTMMEKSSSAASFRQGEFYLAGDVVYLSVAVQLQDGVAPWVLDRAVLKSGGADAGDILAVQSGMRTLRAATDVVFVLVGRLPAGSNGPLSLDLMATDGRRLELELSLP
jgi:hypothetical protein